MSQTKAAITVLVVLILIVGGVYFYKQRGPSITKENVNVSKVDLTKEVGEKVRPTGFPADVPINVNFVTESYTAEYKDRGVTLSALTYRTEEKKADLFSKYVKYLTGNGYVIVDNNVEAGFLSANKGLDTLSIVISSSGELSQVQLAYTARKQQ